MALFEKIKGGLKKTRENMVRQIESVFHAYTKIDEELFEELEEILILADVGAEVSTEICDLLRKKVKETATTDPQEVKRLLKEIILDMLQGDRELHLETKPSVILMIGVNGVGKTTTIGKLTALLQLQGKRVILGAADTFRAAATEQLTVWAEKTNARIVYHEEGSDPASVIFDTIAAAKKRGYDVAICDTAGRLHNKKNLMNELDKMVRIIHREAQECAVEVLLVLDATTGQNGIAQAKEFKDAAGLTGIILTKLDGTAKGGVIVSIKKQLGLPIKFIGVGEQIEDLQPFDPQLFVDALFS